MPKPFEAKVREVGTSLGVLLPKEAAKELGVKKGEYVLVSILKPRPAELKRFFGIDKGTKPFRREHAEREF